MMHTVCDPMLVLLATAMAFSAVRYWLVGNVAEMSVMGFQLDQVPFARTSQTQCWGLEAMQHV